MNSMGKKLILISLILSLAASAAVFAYLNSLKSSEKKTNEVIVLVAAENIPPRTMINKGMIKEFKVADDTAFGTYIKDSSEIIGKYSKETILKNEGFNNDRLIGEKADELSIKIDGNNRAVSVKVTGDSGISDLVKPEDYVDISVYLAEKKEGNEIVRQDTAKVILQNIRVLAVDKQINRDDNDEKEKKGQDAESVPSTFLVTLSVAVSDIEKLVLAESIGSLKLALRPAKEENITDSDGTTWQELMIDKSDDAAGNPGKTENAEDSNKHMDSYKSYTIQKGDTLKKISKAFYGNEDDYPKIKEANGITDENLIFSGQVIKIPSQE